MADFTEMTTTKLLQTEAAEEEVVVMRDYMEVIAIDAAFLFRDQAFLDWLDNDALNIARWHLPGEKPNEYSDIFMTINFPCEGSEYGGDPARCMPEHCWDAIMEVLRLRGLRDGDEKLIWLRNL
jgi:hypothetical protein